MNFWGHRFSQNANQKLPRLLTYPLINFQGRNLGIFWCFVHIARYSLAIDCHHLIMAWQWRPDDDGLRMMAWRRRPDDDGLTTTAWRRRLPDKPKDDGLTTTAWRRLPDKPKYDGLTTTAWRRRPDDDSLTTTAWWRRPLSTLAWEAGLLWPDDDDRQLFGNHLATIY